MTKQPTLEMLTVLDYRQGHILKMITAKTKELLALSFTQQDHIWLQFDKNLYALNII